MKGRRPSFPLGVSSGFCRQSISGRTLGIVFHTKWKFWQWQTLSGHEGSRSGYGRNYLALMALMALTASGIRPFREPEQEPMGPFLYQQGGVV